MKKKTVFLSILMFALFIFLSASCSTKSGEKAVACPVEIKVIPLGCGESFARFSGTFSLYFETDGQKIIGYTSETSDLANTRVNAMAQALVMAKMNDKENPVITLAGFYENNNTFRIVKIKVDEIEVKWE